MDLDSVLAVVFVVCLAIVWGFTIIAATEIWKRRR
jgi:hypothetical protein